MTGSETTGRRRVVTLLGRLAAVYGVPCAAPHGRPVDELVLTVLSQSTNDRNRDVAFLRLRDRFAAWEDVRDGQVEAIEEAIRPGGISRVKSVRLKAILQAIGEPLDLDGLADEPLERARGALLELPGVGRKTAACVLLFALGRPEVPVDTHVGRVAGRLGLVSAAGNPDNLHDQMSSLTPAGRELEMHVNLLRHGRRTCLARAPRCDACALARMCPSRRALSPVAAVQRRRPAPPAVRAATRAGARQTP